MRLLIDRNDDEVLLENVQVLGPFCNASMTLLRCGKFRIFFLGNSRQPFVEERAENMRLASLLFPNQLVVHILEIEVNDDVIQVDVRAEAYVVICCDRVSAATLWVYQQSSKLNFWESMKESTIS